MRNLIQRPRRLRRGDTMRRLVRETRVTVDDLLYPMFVTEEPTSVEIPSMPGIYRYSLDDLGREAEKIVGLGVPAIMLFGIPAEKDPLGSGSYDPNGIVARAIHTVRNAIGD